MGLLDGKKALIFGVANDHSIAWGIAKALHDQGATLGFSSVESADRAARQAARDVDRRDLRRGVRRPVGRADRGRHGEVAATSTATIDILVHALAYAKREDLDGEFANTSRDGFALAMDVSAYSLVALVREARPLLRPGSSVLTLTYYGAEKVVAHYNVMGVAKAALEASRALPRRRPRPVRRPRERDLRRPDPHARRRRHRRLQGDVRLVPRARAPALEHHASRTSARPRSGSPRTCRAR